MRTRSCQFGALTIRPSPREFNQITSVLGLGAVARHISGSCRGRGEGRDLSHLATVCPAKQSGVRPAGYFRLRLVFFRFSLRVTCCSAETQSQAAGEQAVVFFTRRKRCLQQLLN